MIAIIALLMAILMPALSRAKKQAKAVACQANLKQWGQIFLLYCQDNDGYFPTAGSVGWVRGEWIIPLRSHWETKTDLLKCPMARKRLLNMQKWGSTFSTYIMGTDNLTNRQEEASYGGNNWIFNSRSGQSEIQGRPFKWNWKTPYVRGGNKIPLFADTMWRGGGPFYQNGDYRSDRIKPPQYDGQWNNYNSEMMHFCIDRHNGFVNHVFMDCTVRKVGLKELWTLKWHKEFDINGFWTKAGGADPSDWPEWMRKFKDY